MMVVGYNEIVGSVTQKPGHYQKATALGYRRKTSGTQNEGEIKRLDKDNHQTFWSLTREGCLNLQIPLQPQAEVRVEVL